VKLCDCRLGDEPGRARFTDTGDLPRHLASLDLGYRLILRTHGWDGMDLVLDALPR
jgi:hypothetical protein